MALSDDLGELEGEMEEAEGTVGPAQGPLDNPQKSDVAANLTRAQALVGSVLAEIQGVGAADPDALPATLPEIAEVCHNLATTAHEESLRSNPDLTLIGNCIKTIDWIIDAKDGYRELAGIS